MNAMKNWKWSDVKVGESKQNILCICLLVIERSTIPTKHIQASGSKVLLGNILTLYLFLNCVLTQIVVLVAGTSIACRCSELLIVNGPILQSVTVALK